MKRRHLAAVAAVACAMGSAPASAAIVTKSYAFTVTGALGPHPSQSGSFTFEYDDSGPANPVLTSIDYAIGATVFDTSTAGILDSGGQWVLGGLEGGLLSIASPGPSDFDLRFDKVSLAASYLLYHDAAIPGIFLAVPDTITITERAVPEPATWAMMLAGFGAVGYSLRRRGGGARVRIA